MLLGYKWPTLPATLFLQYTRDGNRRNYEMPHFERRGQLSDLVIAECIENEGRFLDDIVNGIWAICEESFWGVSAHIGRQAVGPGLPDTREVIVDLFYIDGNPVIVNAGVETYTAKTFGPQRYEIWTMQSAYHTLLPTIDEVQQAPGAIFQANDVQHQADEQHVTFAVWLICRIRSWDLLVP